MANETHGSHLHAISASTSGCLASASRSRLRLSPLGQLGAKLIELRFPVDRAPRRCQRRGMVSESLGLTSHKSSCNCTGRRSLHQLRREGRGADPRVRLRRDRRRAVLGRLPRGDRGCTSPPRHSAGARRSRDERGPRGVQRGETRRRISAKTLTHSWRSRSMSCAMARPRHASAAGSRAGCARGVVGAKPHDPARAREQASRQLRRIVRSRPKPLPEIWP
jgi:hypothetical protein